MRPAHPMHRPTGASEPSPARDMGPPSESSESVRGREPDPEQEVWFEVSGRDGSLTGTSSRVVHRRAEPGGGLTRHEWAYDELRSLHVLEADDGGSIVIEPLHGPLVPLSIESDQREEAFQAATVLALLIARAQRASPIRAARG